jgi:3-oxoacyl-[acyl-carrier-protein] synthase-3
MTLADLDVVVFHQANAYMLNVVRQRCGIPSEKFYVNFQDVGNTVSSTIPIALKRAIQDKTLQEGQKVLLAGFGVGLSMGATVLNIIENEG